MITQIIKHRKTWGILLILNTIMILFAIASGILRVGIEDTLWSAFVGLALGALVTIPLLTGVYLLLGLKK